MSKANNITQRLNNIIRNTEPSTLAKIAYTTFKEYTPKLTGNAQRRTKLNNNSIHADYPYAKRLDEGYSRQNRGVGMTEPTIKAIQEYIDRKV